MKASVIILFLLLVQLNIICQIKEDTLLTLDNKAYPLALHGQTQEFIRIPGGEIFIGSDDRPDEQPVHKVRIHSFDISSTEVTIRQFRAFVQATGYITDAEKDGHSFACCWRPKLGITWRNPGFIQSDNEP